MAQSFFLVGAGACLSGILHLVDGRGRADLAPTRLLVIVIRVLLLEYVLPKRGR